MATSWDHCCFMWLYIYMSVKWSGVKIKKHHQWISIPDMFVRVLMYPVSRYCSLLNQSWSPIYIPLPYFPSFPPPAPPFLIQYIFPFSFHGWCCWHYNYDSWSYGYCFARSLFPFIWHSFISIQIYLEWLCTYVGKVVFDACRVASGVSQCAVMFLCTCVPGQYM